MAATDTQRRQKQKSCGKRWFLCGPCQGYYNEDQLPLRTVTRVETGSNTFTVILRVVGGDEKESLKSETEIWDSDPRKTTLARAGSIHKRQTRPLVREGAPENKTVTVKE
jgi:hypothetical protein